jgi:hypothetical protein
MRQDLKTESLAKILAELKLLGPPPVLSSEDPKAYDAIMAQFIEGIKPRDFIEQMFVKDATDSTWDIIRYRRHMTLLIEREHQRHLDMEEKRRQRLRKIKAAFAAATARKAKEAGEVAAIKQADQADAPTTQFDRMIELDAVIDGTVPDVDEIVMAPVKELDHAKALQSGIDYFEQLDRLLSVAFARRNDVFRQIEFYRQGLGQDMRRVSDEIIDAEFGETKHEAPSLAGPGGDAQRHPQKRWRPTELTAARVAGRAPTPARPARAATRAGTGSRPSTASSIPSWRSGSRRWWMPSARAMTIRCCARRR